MKSPNDKQLNVHDDISKESSSNPVEKSSQHHQSSSIDRSRVHNREYSDFKRQPQHPQARRNTTAPNNPPPSSSSSRRDYYHPHRNPPSSRYEQPPYSSSRHRDRRPY